MDGKITCECYLANLVRFVHDDLGFRQAYTSGPMKKVQKQWQFFMFPAQEPTDDKEWFPEKGIVSWIPSETVEMLVDLVFLRRGTIAVDRLRTMDILCGGSHHHDKTLKTLRDMMVAQGSLRFRHGNA